MKATVLASIVAIFLIGGAFMLAKENTKNVTQEPLENIAIVDGTQIITINAKGGYQPQKSTAKAGIPTIIRFDTNGTFDCSSAVRIPSMGISQTLPQTGSTDITIGAQQVATLQGTCGMGMYPFEIEFTS